jgi:hypothetical protein
VIANQSLVGVQRINVTSCHVTLATAKTRIEGGDATPADVAQAGHSWAAVRRSQCRRCRACAPAASTVRLPVRSREKGDCPH